MLGEAIASHDFFLLVWSENAAKSHFVEFEWNTAIALKKTIIPCLLDKTPLPVSLSADQGITAENPSQAVPAILAALQQQPAQSDQARASVVIRQLADIKTTKEEEVVRKVKAIFAEDKGLLEKWQTWVAVIVGMFTALSLAADLPGKLGFSIFSSQEPILEQPLAGSVRDEETNEPLAGVDVSLPDLGLTVTTNPAGNFRFQVHAAKQDLVTVMAKKEGYVSSGPKNQILGNTKVLILLKKKVT